MRKYVSLVTILFFSSIVLMACGETEEEEVSNQEETEESNEQDTDTEESTTESEDVLNDESEEAEDDMDEEDEEVMIHEEDKEYLLETYDDHLRLGDTEEWHRSDAIGEDDIEFTVNSFETVDEFDGEESDKDQFLVVNVTVKNLISDENYDKRFVDGTAEGGTGSTVQNEREEDAPEIDEEEDGVSTGNVIFDVEESDHYRLYFFDEYYLIFIDEESEVE